MKHYIIVKFNERVTDKTEFIQNVQSLFDSSEVISGIHGFSYLVNCVDQPNRYDLMIVVHMEKEALPIWDASSLHYQWKEQFGSYILSKAIFDEE